MRTLMRLFATICAAVTCVGCFETIYVSGAPDGFIAVSHENTLYAIPPDAKTATVVAKGVLRAEYSPDGKRLLCVLKKEEDGAAYFEIAVCDTSGKVLVSLDRVNQPDKEYENVGMFSPRWSPDGAYASYLLPSPDGNDLRNLVIRKVDGPYSFTVEAVSSGYGWSADSARVAVISTEAGSGDMASLGSVQVWDVATKSRVMEPAGLVFGHFLWVGFTAEGSIIFSSQSLQLPLVANDFENIPHQIYRLDFFGGFVSLMPVLKPAGLDTGMGGLFDVSPGRDKITYVAWTPRQGDKSGDDSLLGSVYVSDTSGRDPVMILSEHNIRSLPRWLPDGRIAIVAAGDGEEGDEAHIYIITPGKEPVDIWPLIDAAAKKAAGPAPATETPPTPPAESAPQE